MRAAFPLSNLYSHANLGVSRHIPAQPNPAFAQGAEFGPTSPECGMPQLHIPFGVVPDFDRTTLPSGGSNVAIRVTGQNRLSRNP